MSRRSREAPGDKKTLRAAKNGERPGGTESSTAVTKVWYGTDERGFWYRMELFQKEEDGSPTLLHITEEDAEGRTMQLAGYPDKSPMEPSVKEGETLSLKTLLGGLWTEPAETKVQKVEKYQEDHGLGYVIRHKVLQSVFPGTEGKELTGTINRTDTVRTGPDGTVKEFVIRQTAYTMCTRKWEPLWNTGSNFSAVTKPEIWSWDPGQDRQNRGL